MNIEVKLVRDNDEELIKELLEIENEAFGDGGLHNEWLLVPFIRHGRVFALFADGKPAGIAEYMRDWEDPLAVYLIGIAVKEEFRGHGLGREFLKQTIAYMEEEEFVKVKLTVDPNNKPAYNLYFDKFGFDKTGFRKDEYGKGEHRVVMSLSLEDALDDETFEHEVEELWSRNSRQDLYPS